MTSIGFHYFPDERHYRQADLRAWLPELKELGAGWLTVIGSLTRAVPEDFLRGLIKAGIEPIVHVPVTPVRQLDTGALRPLLEAYERWGVKYVVIGSELNLRASWAAGEWSRPALVERVLDLAVPVWQLQVEAGLQPTYPPLRAGGDYWDTSFLEASLAALARRGLIDLARQLTWAVYLWTYNRPVTWGAGGLRRWPEARPYFTPPGSQDQRGFQLTDWYNEIIRARVGEERPMICLAGGPRLGDAADLEFPPMDEARHTSCTTEIAQAITAGALPPNLLNVNLWLLGAGSQGAFSQQAWYRGDGSTLPAVDVLKRFALPTGRPAVSAQGGPDEVAPKTLRHYLLLPTYEWGVSEWHWSAALEYVKAHRPVCGFSPEEARRAQAVTIFGNEQGISQETEATLRRAGCAVERLVIGPDGRPHSATQER